MVEKNKKLTRSEFLKTVAISGVALAGGVSLFSQISGEKKRVPEKKVENIFEKIPDEVVKNNEMLRMQKELLAAIAKPKEEIKWVMVIDLRKCVGCHACTVACQAENVLPPGVIYRKVKEEEFGKYPNVGRRFIPRPCMHCDVTPCVSACPVKATYKDTDGIVAIDYHKCIGCKYCIVTCPYGVRSSDNGKFYTENTPKIQDYEKRPNFEYQKQWRRKKRFILLGSSPIGNARKCHFCSHRIYQGLLPACVVTCIGHATYFGDVNNKESLVAKLSSSANSTVLHSHYNTKPSVYYLT